ncbi:3'-5' exonuclease [Oribacterium sp. P6A1]|uniref:3'-5' exonuclease n=1 Tax=Oribacterium sp. P6A1 TaxID=1410612 RepID=UPI00068DE727|nr:3'-5' exonuclease [Oribacterium sp. P6A1]
MFDLETTGISCEKDRIVEISAVKVENGKVIEEFSELINPECKIPYYASRVNEITDEMVKDVRTFDEVLPDFLGFIGDSILVGHNIQSFDMKFLYRECRELYGETLANDYVDTLYYSRRMLPKLSHHRLTDMAEYFDISTAGAHRAMNDCRMNHEVFERLHIIGK